MFYSTSSQQFLASFGYIFFFFVKNCWEPLVNAIVFHSYPTNQSLAVIRDSRQKTPCQADRVTLRLETYCVTVLS